MGKLRRQRRTAGDDTAMPVALRGDDREEVDGGQDGRPEDDRGGNVDLVARKRDDDGVRRVRAFGQPLADVLPVGRHGLREIVERELLEAKKVGLVVIAVEDEKVDGGAKERGISLQFVGARLSGDTVERSVLLHAAHTARNTLAVR